MDIENYSAQKNYYTIGEVAKMFKLSVSNIRFWEKEFDVLRPKKNRKGDRFFTPQDIEHLKIIYHLVKEKGYTIEGARKKIKQTPDELTDRVALVESLKKLRGFLSSLKDVLDGRNESEAQKE
jgi:DNA-binding transcriptional MerR regulator